MSRPEKCFNCKGKGKEPQKPIATQDGGTGHIEKYTDKPCRICKGKGYNIVKYGS